MMSIRLNKKEAQQAKQKYLEIIEELPPMRNVLQDYLDEHSFRVVVKRRKII